MIERLNDKQKVLLLALAKYKFLTTDQLIRLGVDKHKSNLSKQLNMLIGDSSSYVQKIPHQRGISTKFFLTKKGADLVADYLHIDYNDIQYPKNKIISDTQDQKHRTRIIDLHIALEQGLKNQDVELQFCHRYFDTVGDNRINRNLKSKTAIPFLDSSLKADMVVKLKTSKKEELYIIELENGRDSKKSIKKCLEHASLLFEGGVHNKYDFKDGYRTLWVFEYPSTMNSTLKSMENDPYYSNIIEYMLFGSFSSISSSFFENWVNIQNKKRELFYI